jgi:hypothetical protein
MEFFCRCHAITLAKSCKISLNLFEKCFMVKVINKKCSNASLIIPFDGTDLSRSIFPNVVSPFFGNFLEL